MLEAWRRLIKRVFSRNDGPGLSLHILVEWLADPFGVG
jgi:hypothetical protein